MEELLRAVEQVRSKIEKHRTELQQSEALTRYALIDPILRALGWDTENPGEVRPEFHIETGQPDYALIWEGKPRIMVEAKRLGTDLREARLKGINYTNAKGVPFFVCTDGNLWEVYEVFRPVALEERCIATVNLENESPGEAARKLLALWRPAALQIEVAPPPIVQPPSPPPPGITLSELKARVKRGDKPPQLVSFPDGQREVTQYWKDLLVRVALWVVPNIRKDQIPIHLGSKSFLLSSEPVHSSGKSFYSPERVGKLWLETAMDAPACVRHACRLLEIVGVSPHEVRVEF